MAKKRNRDIEKAMRRIVIANEAKQSKVVSRKSILSYVHTSKKDLKCY